jgi:hypothetical protein
MAHTRLAGENEAHLMIHPKETLGAVRSRAQKTKKTAGRLFVSGLGFSAAFFLDPDHGKERRMRALGFVDHLLHSRADAARGNGIDRRQVPEPEAEVGDLRATFHGAVNGAPASKYGDGAPVSRAVE